MKIQFNGFFKPNFLMNLSRLMHQSWLDSVNENRGTISKGIWKSDVTNIFIISNFNRYVIDIYFNWIHSENLKRFIHIFYHETYVYFSHHCLFWTKRNKTWNEFVLRKFKDYKNTTNFGWHGPNKMSNQENVMIWFMHYFSIFFCWKKKLCHSSDFYSFFLLSCSLFFKWTFHTNWRII